MLEIICDYPKKKYYDFICDNFSWKWGDINLFRWKHIEDPYRKASDFFLVLDNKQIKALCVGRVYPFIYKEKHYQILSMMDFVTEKASREKGYMTMLSNYIKEKASYDFSIGFSSEKLFHTVYKSKHCLQVYYRYEFTSNCTAIKTGSDDLVSKPLKSNPSALQIVSNNEYIQYLKKSCKYERIILVQDSNFFIWLGINGETGLMLDISDYSENACYHAVEIAKPYCKYVQIDFPRQIGNGDGQFIKSTFVVIDGQFNNYGETIWVPVLDRK